MVKRDVQTIKKMFKKVLDDGEDTYLALFQYRNTPTDKIIKSPNF